MLVHCGWGYTKGLSCYRKHYGDSSKIKNRSTMWSSNPSYGYMSNGNKNRISKICASIFITALITKPKYGNKWSVHQQMIRWWRQGEYKQQKNVQLREEQGNWRRHRLAIGGWISSGGLMHSIVTIINTVLSTCSRCLSPTEDFRDC